jgi:hypothetical protein
MIPCMVYNKTFICENLISDKIILFENSIFTVPVIGTYFIQAVSFK